MAGRPLFAYTNRFTPKENRRNAGYTHILWDCIPLIDDGFIQMVKGIGGISAIAISHPHYYTSMVE